MSKRKESKPGNSGSVIDWENAVEYLYESFSSEVVKKKVDFVNEFVQFASRVELVNGFHLISYIRILNMYSNLIETGLPIDIMEEVISIESQTDHVLSTKYFVKDTGGINGNLSGMRENDEILEIYEFFIEDVRELQKKILNLSSQKAT